MSLSPRLGLLGVPLQLLEFRLIRVLRQLRGVSFAGGIGVGLLVVLMSAARVLLGAREPDGPGFRRRLQVPGTGPIGLTCECHRVPQD